MAVNRLLNIRPQYVDANGNPANGYRLFFYVAGSTTKQDTFNDSTGASPNANPIVLNSSGRPDVEIWGTVGQNYKIGFAAPGADDPPGAFVWTEDNVATPDPASGASATTSEWQTYSGTPTFLSGTSFRISGDQRTTFHIGRRVRSTITAGTAYSTVTNSTFSASNTTVTVTNDSTAIDSGLSAVAYGVVSAVNTSVPWLADTAFTIHEPTLNSTARIDLGGLGSSQNRIIRLTNSNVALGPNSDLIDFRLNYTYISSPGRWQFGLRNWGGTIPSANFPIGLRFRSTTASNGQFEWHEITSDLNFIVGDGSTFGTVSGVPFRLYFVAVNAAGTIIPAIYNPVLNSGGVIHHRPLDEGQLYTTVSGSNTSTADSAHVLYGTSVTSNRAIRILGYIEGVQSTAGTHANGVDNIVTVNKFTPRSGSVWSFRRGVYTSNTTGTNPLTNSSAALSSTDGDQYMSEAYAPMSAANILRVTASWCGAHNNENHISALMRKDSTVIRAMKEQQGTTNLLGRVDMQYMEIAGSTSSRTYSVRAGSGGAGTTTFNGQSGGAWYGGVVESFLEIEEIFA